MRRFRFKGVSSRYAWDKNPVKNQVYSVLDLCKMFGNYLRTGNMIMPDILINNLIDDTEDWEEVYEVDPKDLNNSNSSIIIEPKNHKDTDLGYFTEVFINYQMYTGNIPDIKWAVDQAKELIKQLDQECQ